MSAVEVRLWMSVYRQGTPHHKVFDALGVRMPYTDCGRYVGPDETPVSGVLVTEAEAAVKQSPQCPRCFGGVW